MERNAARTVEPEAGRSRRRTASAGLAAVLAAGVALCSAVALPAVAADPASGTVDIELRKSFTRPRGPGRQPARQGGGTPAQDAGNGGARDAPRPEGAVADALGEPLAVDGALHLPLPGGREIVLPEGQTPVLDTVGGRHVIIDAGARIGADDAAAIAKAWPAYAVVQPPAGGGLRELLDRVLAAAGYASVERATPLVIGRGATVRLTPDFLVQRDERDLIAGELRAISVVDPADALPPELRELAAERRVRVLEIGPDGVPAGPERAPWRDPGGHVTTMDTGSLPGLLAEIGEAVGVGGEPAAAAAAALREARGPDRALGAVGDLLARAGVPAIGPTVEFFRSSAAGARGRFVISVPGWLAEHDGRRLLITGASPPLPLRLYLTREGIDLFEYRLR